MILNDPNIVGKDMKEMPTMPAPKEFEEMAEKWVREKKPSKIAASFTKVEDLREIHLKHFRGAPYIWKPMQGGIWGGMLMDDSIPYVHLVLCTTPVVEFILNLKADASDPNRGRIQLTEIPIGKEQGNLCQEN